MVRALFVSDLHIRKDNKDEQLSVLHEIVERHDPDYIFHLGDTDDTTIFGDKWFHHKIINEKPIYAIVGNHDFPAPYKNVKGEKIFLQDGYHEFDGMKILTFDGVFSFYRKKFYHKSLDEAVMFGFGYRDTKPHFLLTHEIPYGNWYRDYTFPEYLSVLNFVERITGADIHIFGHLHVDEPYSLSLYSDTMQVRIDTSQHHHSYVVADVNDGEIERIVIDVVD